MNSDLQTLLVPGSFDLLGVMMFLTARVDVSRGLLGTFRGILPQLWSLFHCKEKWKGMDALDECGEATTSQAEVNHSCWKVLLWVFRHPGLTSTLVTGNIVTRGRSKEAGTVVVCGSYSEEA